MRVLFACLTGGLMLIASPLWSQPLGILKGEKVTLAPLIAPEIVRARATEEKGEVHIWISSRSIRGAEKKGGGPGGRDYLYIWAEASIPWTLGKDVLAYSRAGKPLGKETVTKALAKTATVPYFYVVENYPEVPDLVYREVFREDVVILVYQKSNPQPDR